MKPTLSAILLTVLTAVPAAAQETPWSWRKAIPGGQTVEIRGVIGHIRATAASGDQVEIVARKQGRRYDASSVRIGVVETAGGVVVCAIYNERADDCDDRNASNTRDNDTEVDFEVRIPRGVNFKGSNVAGAVEATGLDARVQASTVSGDVRVSTSGIAHASSVSGSLRVRMGRADWSGRLAFSTVSGDIDLEFASDVNADVEFSTVSGEFESDWPLAVTTGGRRDVHGRIGAGGRELDFSTVSGSVTIRRAAR